MDTKEYEANALTQLSAFSYRGQRGSIRGAGQTGNQRRGQGGIGRGQRLFCRVCYAARSSRHVFTSHNVANCSKWTRKDVDDLRVMICELNTNPNLYPESSSDTEQDKLAGEEIPQLLETIKSVPTDFKTPYQNRFLEEYTHIFYPFSCLSADYCQCKRNSCQLRRIVPVSSPV